MDSAFGLWIIMKPMTISGSPRSVFAMMDANCRCFLFRRLSSDIKTVGIFSNICFNFLNHLFDWA